MVIACIDKDIMLGICLQEVDQLKEELEERAREESQVGSHPGRGTTKAFHTHRSGKSSRQV